MSIGFVSIACLALLQFLLALNVSLQRMHHRISHGHPEDPAHSLYRAVVAHRNCCEFGPVFAILILVLQYAGQPAWALILAPLAVLARTLHAISLVQFSLKKANPLRRLSAGLTYTLGFLMVGLLFYSRIH
jgi:uncharacterized membrane protein YecN with MAPEG domain